jgi:heterotetrameric sarcosine oxidase gamma subunit
MLSDESLAPKWRLFSSDVPPGRTRKAGEGLAWSVAPGELNLLSARPSGTDVVDITHVRAMFRLSGSDAADVLAKVCGLDLGDAMFPDGAAARTLVAGVATELIRDDRNEVPSYLILPSRSFGLYLYEVILDAGKEFGLSADT